MGKVAELEELAGIREKHPRKCIGICTGCFDILQSGHAVFFNQCKEYCDILIVVVGRACVVSQLKPGRPINSDNNRVYLLAALQDVDYAVLGDESTLPGKIDCFSVCDLVRPDVYILNDDDSGLDHKRAFCSIRGIKLRLVPRIVPDFLTATSTTEVIDKANLSKDE